MRVDFADADGSRLDVQPLIGTDILGFNYSGGLNLTGAFGLSVAANSERASAVAIARQIWVNTDEGYVFKGVIEEVQHQVSVDGSAILQVNGRSLAAKLAWKTTLLGRTFDNQTLSSVVTTLLTGSGFSAGEIASPLTNISTRFDGRSLWDALRFVAEVFGLSLREDNLAGEVDIAEFGDASGIVLKNLPALSPNQASNLNIVPIKSIKKHTYALDIVNKVIPIAQQSGIAGSTVWFNLADSTRVSPYTIGSATGPDGFTYYYLQDTASIAIYGTREKVIQVKDILPLGVSTTDFQRAANTLYDEAVTYLQRHKDEQAAFDVEVVGLTHVSGGYRFQPGDTFRVQYSGTTEDVDGTRATLTVDQDLYLMAYSRTFDASGADTWKLTLSTILREIPDDGNRTAAFLRELEAIKAAPLPYVLFGDNVMRLDQTAIQISSQGTGYKALSFLYDFVDASLLPDAVRGYVSGFSNAAGTVAEVSMGAFYDALTETRLSARAESDGDRYVEVNPMILMDQQLTVPTAYVSGGFYYDIDGLFHFNQGGTDTTLGGSMKTANTGQFLIPPGPSAGNWLRSGAANVYGAWKPLPVASAVAPAAPTETSNSANVAMPATVAAGDLLVVLAAAHTAATVGTGSGFTQLGTGTNTVNLKVFYKVAAGTEGGTTVSFANCDAAQVYRILAANYVGIPTISTVATGTGTTAEPTAVVPSAGQFLSIAVAAVQGDLTVNVTASPSGYSTIDTVQEGAGSDIGGVSLGSAYLADSGVSEDPTSFTNGSNPWVAFAVAIAASNAVTEDTYITDLAIEISGSPTYAQVQLGTGAVGAESAIGTYKLTPSDWTLQCGAVVPVTSGTRLSARIATSAAAADHFLTLGMLNQDDAL